MQGQGYYNNQSGYPMAPGYGQPPPQYGAYPGGPVPIQSQPETGHRHLGNRFNLYRNYGC